MFDKRFEFKMKNIILLSKIILLRFFEKLATNFLMPVNYTVSVTYRCNSRCKTCNIYKTKSEELSSEEYEKIFKKIGKSVYWITISGGEPFLRKDLFDIVLSIYKYCKPKIINIPTNGLLYKEIPRVVKKIVKNCPKTDIVINVSIDEIGEKNNEIRGVKNAYKSAIKTVKAIQKIDLPNLNLGIHSVISKFNVDDFKNVADELMALNPDSYVTEIAENRVELDTMEADITPSLMKYSNAIDYLLFQIKNTKFKGMNKITQTFRIEYYKLVKKILKEQKEQIKCFAGILSAQIVPNGDVWTCCILAKVVGNLKKYNYDFRKLWFKNPKLKKERKRIRNEKCFCPMANATYTNMLMNNKILLKAIFRFFRK